MHTFVIAELGSCHNNSLDEAKTLIEVAKVCGADAAKFQYWSSARRMAYRRHVPQYEEMYNLYRMPIDWLLELRNHAADIGIEFMCSTYLPEDVAVIEPLVKTMKIASFEANDPQHLVAHVKPMGWREGERKRLIVSMGLEASAGPIREFLTCHLPVGTNEPSRVNLLRCVSAYPAPIEELQLVRLRVGSAWHTGMPLDGLSDHTAPNHTLTGALAVAAGATIIERHLRNVTTPIDNPDYPHAMGPAGFSEYVDNIRFAEKALGVIGPAPAEIPMRALRVRE